MDYKGFTISRCDDNGIIREVNGVKKATEGLFFRCMLMRIWRLKLIISVELSE